MSPRSLTLELNGLYRPRARRRGCWAKSLTAYSRGWLVGSGFVHGRPYASDMLLSSLEVGVKEGITIQRVMGSVDDILWAMSCADMMLSRALQLYHTRGAARPDAS
jgi:hypothetical protein